MFRGLWGAAKYRNVADWGCLNDDYPIAYFVGFRVRDIGDDGSILVTRERDIVNVISLKALDPKLDKHTKVKISQGDKVLCQDIGKASRAFSTAGNEQIADLAGQGRRSYLSAVTSIADKGGCGRIVRFVPIADITTCPV